MAFGESSSFRECVRGRVTRSRLLLAGLQSLKILLIKVVTSVWNAYNAAVFCKFGT